VCDRVEGTSEFLFTSTGTTMEKCLRSVIDFISDRTKHPTFFLILTLFLLICLLDIGRLFISWTSTLYWMLLWRKSHLRKSSISTITWLTVQLKWACLNGLVSTVKRLCNYPRQLTLTWPNFSTGKLVWI